tara:strand:- start:363 stop:1202 length:840 start_codon:yes stop_codon:yes gene_type:complete
MLKTPHFLLLVGMLAAPVASHAEPEIVKETREENGKKVEYMFIDGIKVHETDAEKQPQPPVVEPKPYDAEAAKAPEGATVLFDGSDAAIENWSATNGQPTKWKLVDGALESVKGAGYIQSKEEFGSCRLHVEFATPSMVQGNGQGRGNSGVFLMGQYEVQVLDSYENTTYPDGQCGALYGRAKPLVNASRKPGEWQTYDITFHRPVFAEDGTVTRKARFHVVHNGHVIHDNVQITGGTGWRGPHSVSEYQKHADTGPLKIQDHGNPVRFRNIWIQPIED